MELSFDGITALIAGGTGIVLALFGKLIAGQGKRFGAFLFGILWKPMKEHIADLDPDTTKYILQMIMQSQRYLGSKPGQERFQAVKKALLDYCPDMLDDFAESAIQEIYNDFVLLAPLKIIEGNQKK